MRRIATWQLGVALVAITVVFYLPLWRNDFVDLDDEWYITLNPQVVQGLSWSGFRWAWTTLHGTYWQPLSWLSLQFDAQCFSGRSLDGRPVLSPAAFHIDSLCWHAAAVLLLFTAWQRMTGARWRSFLVAALFAVHPMHVESVAWATERKDVLCAFFGALTLWAYVCYRERPGWPRYLGMAAAYLLCLLSKPMLITLPFMLLLLDYWPLRRSAPIGWRRLMVEKAPLLVLAGAVGVVTHLAREQGHALTPLDELPLSARLANAVTAYGWYVGRTFAPVDLAALYPHPLRNWSVAAALAGAGMLVAVTALAWWQRSQRPWLIVGWLWFVCTLLPVIGLVQGGEQAWADRFSYWAHVGFFVVLAWGLAEFVERCRVPRLLPGLAGAAGLGCLGALTWAQACTWRDSITLWERQLAVVGDNCRAHMALGQYYMDRGRLDLAEPHLVEAVHLKPAEPPAHYLLGSAQFLLGRLEEAGEQMQVALELSPDYLPARLALGTVSLRLERPEPAAGYFRAVLNVQPDSDMALAGLGLALWDLGERAEAVRLLRAALDQNPRSAEAWHGLGRAALADGRPAEAADALRRAMHFKPDLARAVSDLGVALGRLEQWPEAVQMHLAAMRMQEVYDRQRLLLNGRVPTWGPVPDLVLFQCRLAFAFNQAGDRRIARAVYHEARKHAPEWPELFTAKAWTLATDSKPGRRDPRLAADLAGEAIQGVDDPTPAMLDALAAAQAALGQFSDAVETARQALDALASAPEPALVAGIRDRLRNYEKGEAAMARRP